MLLVICLVLMFLYRHKNYSIPIAINLMVSVSLNDALKNLFLRDRPPLALRAIAETGYSFPSGHAMAAAAFYGFLMYLVWQSAWPLRRKRRTALLLGLLIGMINGFGVTVLKIPSIIMTLGINGIVRGMIYVYTNGKWVEK